MRCGLTAHGLLRPVRKLRPLVPELLPQISSIGLLILLPLVHFGVITPLAPAWSGEDVPLPEHWDDPSLVVCRCNCSGKLLPDPRHFHLRPTNVLFTVLVISLLFSLILHELMARLVHLYTINELRPHFGLAVLMSFHSLYKTFWILVTLYNREYFYKFYHESLHSILHVAQVYILSQGCDQRIHLGLFKMIVLLKTSIGRMLVLLKDQVDIYLWFGVQFRVYWLIPDLFFFLSDVLAAVVCVEEIVFMAHEQGIKLKSIFLTKRYLLGATAFFCFILFAGEYFPED